MAHFKLSRTERLGPYVLRPTVNIDPANGFFSAMVEVRYYCGADDEKPDDFGYNFQYVYLEMGTEYRIVTESEYDDLVSQAAAHGDTFNPETATPPVRVYVEGLGDDVALCFRECQKMQKAFEALMALDYFKLEVTF